MAVVYLLSQPFVLLSFLAAFLFALGTMRRYDRYVELVIRRQNLTMTEVGAMAAVVVAAFLLRRVWHPGAAALPFIWIVVLLVLIWFATFVRFSAPVALIGAGVMSNLITVASNRFLMPADGLESSSPEHILIGASSRLWYLADIFTFESGPFIGGYSIGDCAMNAGFWWLNARLWLGIGGRHGR